MQYFGFNVDYTFVILIPQIVRLLWHSFAVPDGFRSAGTYRPGRHGLLLYNGLHISQLSPIVLC